MESHGPDPNYPPLGTAYVPSRHTGRVRELESFPGRRRVSERDRGGFRELLTLILFLTLPSGSLTKFIGSPGLGFRGWTGFLESSGEKRLPNHQKCFSGRLMKDNTHNKISCFRGHVLILPHPCLLVRLPQSNSYSIRQLGERHFKYLSLGEHGIGPILDRVRDVISSVVGHEGIPGRNQARGSARVGSLRRILGFSGSGSRLLALGFQS